MKNPNSSSPPPDLAILETILILKSILITGLMKTGWNYKQFFKKIKK